MPTLPKSGLLPIRADRRDYDLIGTYGSLAPDPKGLPDQFSVYDGQKIPSQLEDDFRLGFQIPPLWNGCTGETGAFACNLQDDALYNPQDLYLNTPPGDPNTGRNMRAMLNTLKERGPRKADGSFGPKRTAYFTVYGAGKIDDTDAARIALWINQMEKRTVIVGTWWYWQEETDEQGTVTLPSFRLRDGTLHAYLITGWRTRNGQVELEAIPWLGERYGFKGLFYIPRPIYNGLLGQPYTAAFTVTKTEGLTPIPIGWRAVYDHIVYSLVQFVRDLYSITP